MLESNKRHIINMPVILRFIGWLLLIEAAFMLLPLLVALYYKDTAGMWSFGFSSAITAFIGALMTFGIRPENTQMRTRDGILLTSVVWIFFSFFGMLPYMFTGTLTDITDAFFETMSGFTTTGSTVIDNIDHTNRSVLFWRALTQWIGGMGIIVFTLAVLPMLNYKGGITLFNAEVSGINRRRMQPRVSSTAKGLWGVYVIMTLVMAALLVTRMGWFDALCQTMTTVSTGGFSTHNLGMRYWDSNYVYGIVTIFMFLAGINFPLLYGLFHGRFRLLKGNNTFKCFIAEIFIFAAIIMAKTWPGTDNLTELLNHAVETLYTTVSAVSTTGFAFKDYGMNSEFVSLLLMFAMFFGGMAGSTTGGAKIDRAMVLFKNVKNEFYRLLHPNSVLTVRVNGAAMPSVMVYKVIAFLSLYVIMMAIVAVVLSMTGMPLSDSLYTSLACVSNAGVGYGMTGPDGLFSYLPSSVKWLLSGEMLIGRLELYTVLVVFTRGFWKNE